MPRMNDVTLLRAIREQPPAPVYLIYGSETYYSGVCLDRLLGKLVKKGTESFNLRRYDGETLDMTALRNECESLPLMADYKCVVVTDLNLASLSEPARKTLEGILDDPNPSTVLIFYMKAYEPQPKKSAKVKKLMEKIEKVGVVAEINPKTRSELSKILRQKFQKAGCEISPAFAGFLVDRCGSGMETLLQEADKLIAYKGQGEITKADIELITHKTLESTVFDLTRALFGSRPETAFQILQDLFAEREEPMRILSVLSSSVLDLYRAKAALNAGKGMEDILALYSYGGRAFLVKNAIQDAPRYSMRSLRAAVEVLTDTETAMKSGGGEDKTLLEEAVFKILTLRSKG